MAKRDSLPQLKTETSTTKASASRSSSASQAKNTPSGSRPTISSKIPPITHSSAPQNALPTLVTTSSSLSSTSYTFHESVPTDESKNPYIITQTIAPNFAFIIVAAVLGALAIGVFSTWMIVSWRSRKRAKSDKEAQYFNPFHYESRPDPSASHLMSGSSQSSFLEKSSSSVSSKFSNPVNLCLDTTTPGRSYREMLHSMSRRGSMTISPVLEMMRSSASNLDLPLFNLLPESSLGLSQGSPEPSQRPARKSRPPSQVVDDMLTAMEFSTSYPEAQLDSSPQR